VKERERERTREIENQKKEEREREREEKEREKDDIKKNEKENRDWMQSRKVLLNRLNCTTNERHLSLLNC